MEFVDGFYKGFMYGSASNRILVILLLLLIIKILLNIKNELKKKS